MRVGVLACRTHVASGWRPAGGLGLVTSYENWAEFDGPGINFPQAFVEVYGVAAWTLYREERVEPVIGVEDEWRQRIPALGGATSGNQ